MHEKTWKNLELPSRQRVLCVGDLILDRFHYGSVDRISPESPVPVLRVQKESCMLGGAGNVARNLSSLNARCCVVSVLGSDQTGRMISNLLSDLPGVDSQIVTDETRQTTVKTRYVAATQQLLRVDHESTIAVTRPVADDIRQYITQQINDLGVLVISDYGKGVLTPDLTHTLIQIAKTKNVVTIVDPKGSDYQRYTNADIVTPNRKELALATGLPTSTRAEVEMAARRLIEQYHFRHVVATLSDDGMLLVDQDGFVAHHPTLAREVYDVSGAGDTVVAALAASLAANLSIKESIQLANRSGRDRGQPTWHGRGFAGRHRWSRTSTPRNVPIMGSGHWSSGPMETPRAHRWIHKWLLRSFASRPFEPLAASKERMRSIDRWAKLRQLRAASQRSNSPHSGRKRSRCGTSKSRRRRSGGRIRRRYATTPDRRSCTRRAGKRCGLQDRGCGRFRYRTEFRWTRRACRTRSQPQHNFARSCPARCRVKEMACSPRLCARFYSARRISRRNAKAQRLKCLVKLKIRVPLALFAQVIGGTSQTNQLANDDSLKKRN